MVVQPKKYNLKITYTIHGEILSDGYKGAHVNPLNLSLKLF